MGKRGHPLTDEERERILDLLDEGKTHGQIAKEVGRSPQTVGRVARAAGKSVDHSNLARVSRARETKKAVDAERRAEHAVAASGKLAEAMNLLGHDVYETVVVPGGRKKGGGTNRATVELVEVPARPRDWRDQATAARTLQQLMLDLIRYDDTGTDARSVVDDWLKAMTG